MRISWKPKKEHHWKLMAIATMVVFASIPLALAQHWYCTAVVLLIGLATIAVQWITIDPPYVDSDDLYGPEQKPKRDAKT